MVEDRFHTNLVVQNDSSMVLTLEIVPDNIFLLPIQDSAYIDSNSSTEGFILPSEFEFLESIRLYSSDEDDNLILVYQQNPIDDELWVINESTTRDVDHILNITDELLNN